MKYGNEVFSNMKILHYHISFSSLKTLISLSFPLSLLFLSSSFSPPSSFLFPLEPPSPIFFLLFSFLLSFFSLSPFLSLFLPFRTFAFALFLLHFQSRFLFLSSYLFPLPYCNRIYYIALTSSLPLVSESLSFPSSQLSFL